MRFPVVFFALVLFSAALPLPVDGKPVVVAFGDSTTAPRGEIRIYATILGEELPRRGLVAEIVNAGVGGNHTVQARARFKREVLDQKPDLVIIQFGINDAAVDVWKTPPATTARVSLAAYEGNLRFFVKKLRAVGAVPILMTPNPMGWTPKLKELYGKPPYDPERVEGFNVVLKNYAERVRVIAEEEKVPLIDVFKELEGKTATMLLDGMHPNDKGQRLVADKLMPVVAKALKVK